MSLKVVHGKPGSGKTCYVVSLLYEMLLDWARYLIKHDEAYSRKLYTNIPLDVDAINEAASKELGTEIDFSEQIVILDDSFFRGNGGYRDWWEDFEEKAFVVIDEVHHYLPASMKRKKCDQSDRFMNYISTHRHRQHDVILLTQHVGNILVEAKKMIEVLYEVLNVKNTHVGWWPFRVPMSDIDVVREAWGMPVQMAHIKRGVMEASKVVYDKNFEVFILTPFLFSLYRSHTLTDEALDRPSLRLGRVGSLIWFARRHAFRFGFWTIFCICILIGIRNVISELPKALVGSLVPPSDAVSSPPTTVPPPPPSQSIPSEALSRSIVVSPPLEDDKILGFVRGGVITSKGILRSGDHLIVDGQKESVSSVDVRRRILYLGTGKKVQK